MKTSSKLALGFGLTVLAVGAQAALPPEAATALTEIKDNVNEAGGILIITAAASAAIGWVIARII